MQELKKVTLSKVRVYRVMTGNLGLDQELKLHRIRSFDSMGEARRWLKSRECLLEQLRDRNTPQAEFLIIPEKDHYRMAPVTVLVSETLPESELPRHGELAKGYRL